MTQTDKEKIKEVLEFIDSFLVEKGGDDVIVNWDGQTPRSLLEFIKKDLEKMTMNDNEKIEAIKKIFDQSRMKRMSLVEEFGEEELTGMNDAIERIVYS